MFQLHATQKTNAVWSEFLLASLNNYKQTDAHQTTEILDIDVEMNLTASQAQFLVFNFNKQILKKMYRLQLFDI